MIYYGIRWYGMIQHDKRGQKRAVEDQKREGGLKKSGVGVREKNGGQTQTQTGGVGGCSKTRLPHFKKNIHKCLQACQLETRSILLAVVVCS